MNILNPLKKLLHIGMFNPSNYGHFGDKVGLSSDTIITNPRNAYFYGNNGLKSAIILCNHAKFIMKKNSGASYGLKVSTGNHARIVGIPYRNIKGALKPDGLDHDVIVEEDVWMGFNVTILNGVTIRRGTTVAAGAVVTKSTPPYCIVGGVPARFLKFYWTIDEIIDHERKIYPEKDRLSEDELRLFFDKYKKNDNN